MIKTENDQIAISRGVYDRLRDLVILFAQEASYWQPIDTAPKWATILLYDEEWEGTIGSIQLGFVKDDGEILSEAWLAGCKPTHWMPLPKPPQLETQG